MISIEQLSLQLAGRPIFDEVSLTIHAGECLGLTGRNGTGKSTLFKLLLGELEPDSGQLNIAGTPLIAHTEQEITLIDMTAVEFVLSGDQILTEWQKRLEEAQKTGDQKIIADANEHLDAIDAWSADARARKLLAGLGFTSDKQDQLVKSFSGGWRMRLALARALMAPSDILLLDEPTNHLDIDAILWLERYLQSYQGTLMIISHDRVFLDNLVKRVLHIEHNKISSWTGNYSAYEHQRAEQLNLASRQQRKIAAKRSSLQSFITRFKAKASKAKQAQSRIKALEKLDDVVILQSDSAYQFEFIEPEHEPRPLIKFDDVALGYQVDRPLITGLNLTLNAGDRYGILGPNGTGKSTFIKTIARELEPVSGECWRSKHFHVGYFAQHQLETLLLDQSPIEMLQKHYPDHTEQMLRDYLGSFGFRGERIDEPIRHFSGGEKARLVLANIIKKKPNLLLLDEPTNHLDISMRESLALALQNYSGAMLIVSHDRHLLETVCDEFFLVSSGTLSTFDGDLADYQAWLKSSSKTTSDNKATRMEPALNKKQLRQQQAENRARTAPLRKAIASLDKALSSAQSELNDIEQALSEPEIYESDQKERLAELLKQQGELRKNIEQLELEWFEQTEALEQASAED